MNVINCKFIIENLQIFFVNFTGKIELEDSFHQEKK